MILANLTNREQIKNMKHKLPFILCLAAATLNATSAFADKKKERHNFRPHISEASMRGTALLQCRRYDTGSRTDDKGNLMNLEWFKFEQRKK